MARKRGHGEGTIYKRKDGRWEAKASIGYDSEGKPKRITRYFKTRKEAQDWLAQVQHERNVGTFVEPDKITFGEWLMRWLETYKKPPKIRPTSYANYLDAAKNHITPSLGHIPLQSLRTSDIQAFYNRKEKENLSAWVIHRFHVLISGALKQAVRERFIAFNPAEYTTRPPIKQKEMQVLNVEEANRYLEAARDHRLYAAFLLEMTTALRRGELLALRWQDVDLANGTVTVKGSLTRVRYPEEGVTRLELTEPKTEASKRTIPLLPEVVRELKRLRKLQNEEKLFFGPTYQDNGLVFATPTGGMIDPRTFHRWHTAVLRKAGLRHVRVHDLRHTVATIVLQAGENPENLRALLGHTRTSTTLDLYCHSDEEGKKKAVAKLRGILRI